MKKTTVLIMVLMLAVLASAAVAGDKGEGMVGRLFLFQKCVDLNSVPEEDKANYDAFGCPPAPADGEKGAPWPIIPDNRRWGQMKYNLLGPEFRFSFQGKNLVPDLDYTLIYYPDPWPGNGLMCLGSGATNEGGNLQIHGKLEIPGGLPASYDANFAPVAPSGAVGAKIWLVPAMDVKCESSGDIVAETGLPADPARLLTWNPSGYLFEGNLIIYQYMAPAVVEDEDADGDADVEEQEPEAAPTIAATPGNQGNNGKGNAYGKAK